MIERARQVRAARSLRMPMELVSVKMMRSSPAASSLRQMTRSIQAGRFFFMKTGM